MLKKHITCQKPQKSEGLIDTKKNLKPSTNKADMLVFRFLTLQFDHYLDCYFLTLL